MTKRLVSVIAILLGVTLLTASLPYNYGYVNAEVAVVSAKVPKYESAYTTYKKVKWVKKSGKWYCKNSKGKYIKGFAKISGKTYYFNSKGVMQTKWKTISKKKYYFGSDGVMRTGLKKISKKYYHFNSKGVMSTGWKTYNGEKYYFGKTGAAYTGWKTIGGYEYYFTSKGKMKHDTVVDGKTLDHKGRVVKPSEATATATAAATTTAPADSTPTASAAATATATSAATATTTATATGSTSLKYDPDGHGGYWIHNGTGAKVSASEYQSMVSNGQSYKLSYVCSNGNTISYSTYPNMNWSMKNDPKFGAYAASSDMYKGSWWQQGYGNGISYKNFDDTGYVASWIYGTSAAFNAFDYDSHISGSFTVGGYANGGKQTIGYTGWNGNAVTGGDYSKWAIAMDAYRALDGTGIPARHDKATCERYGIAWSTQSTKVYVKRDDGTYNTVWMDVNQAEKLGDYIMIEWCEGNLQYNMKTLPVPDFQNYTGMGSVNYEDYFITCSTVSDKFPTSKDWNYADKEANLVEVIPADPTSTPAPATEAPPTNPPAANYSYEIIPLLAPFNRYFYIKTENPDPDSFRFKDEDTKYSEDSGSIIVSQNLFADVNYEDPEIFRVNGGYIAEGSLTDGGTVRLQYTYVSHLAPNTNAQGDILSYRKVYNITDSDITYETPDVVSTNDYLINTYANETDGFFEKVTAVQNGLSSICLYHGAFCLGDLKKDENSYWGMSTSPHADQSFYIQDPYYREGNKPMLVGSLYPFALDSLGFPATMASIAKQIDPSCTYTWDTYSHSTIHVTLNGETECYGGSGIGGCDDGVTQSMIKYYFSFNGSAQDLYGNCSLSSLASMNNEYGRMPVTDEREDLLTLQSIRDNVGKEGKYVRLYVPTSDLGIFGAYGYTYLFDNGATGEGVNGFLGSSIGHFENAWFDGRYYTTREYWYPRADLEKTATEEHPFLVFKDMKMKLPDSDEGIYVARDTSSGIKYKLDNNLGYDPETGVWKGFSYFKYDVNTNSWNFYYFHSYDGARVSITNGLYVGNTDNELTDAGFIDACEITLEEAKSMGVDKNNNVEPPEFLIYDQTEEPGTVGYASVPTTAPAQSTAAPTADPTKPAIVTTAAPTSAPVTSPATSTQSSQEIGSDDFDFN